MSSKQHDRVSRLHQEPITALQEALIKERDDVLAAHAAVVMDLVESGRGMIPTSPPAAGTHQGGGAGAK